LVRTPAALSLLAAAVAAAAGCGGSDHEASTTTTVATTTTAAKPPTRAEFVSRPDLHPPVVSIRRPPARTAPGYLFLAPKEKTDPGGPMILDNRGQVVWFHQVQPSEATDFRVQTYRGRPVLTWWEGKVLQTGVGFGRYVIADDRYRTIARFTAANGVEGDLHEFTITPRNTALVVAYKAVQHDLTSVGGPKDGWTYDSIVQELAIPSGKVLFEWHSLDHVPVAESVSRKPAKNPTKDAPFDYFHVNSVGLDRDGSLLVSGRNTHAVYKISRPDGSVVWRLGGSASDFRMPDAARFAYQHDARRQADGTVTIFDNGATPKVHEFTRGLVLRLDEKRKRVRVMRTYVHPDKLLSPYEGNQQRLPDGHVLMGYGGIPVITEYARGGRVLFDAKLAVGDFYRAYRFTWTGRPTDRPAVAARTSNDGVTIYASWNGATQVRTWEVLAGDDPVRLTRLQTARKRGFETAIPLDGDAAYVKVRALDAAGHVLGTSAATKL
jgi:hypothetical protein